MVQCSVASELAPVSSGQPRTWACAIILRVGSDKFSIRSIMKPCMTMATYVPHLESARAPPVQGAHHFRHAETHQLDPKWSLQRLLDNNPLVWMAEVNGILVDLRQMAREVQEIAFQKA